MTLLTQHSWTKPWGLLPLKFPEMLWGPWVKSQLLHLAAVRNWTSPGTSLLPGFLITG